MPPPTATAPSVEESAAVVGWIDRYLVDGIVNLRPAHSASAVGGCAQCHGDRGTGGVSPDVPALNTLGSAFTVAQLTDIATSLQIEAAGASGQGSKEFVWFSPSKGRTQTTTTAAVPSIDGVDDWTLVSDPRLNPGA